MCWEDRRDLRAAGGDVRRRIWEPSTPGLANEGNFTLWWCRAYCVIMLEVAWPQGPLGSAQLFPKAPTTLKESQNMDPALELMIEFLLTGSAWEQMLRLRG